MEKIGQFLKNKRLENNLSLEEVSEIIKIKKKYLDAIENEDLTIFVSYSYYQGFLRQYIKFLDVGIDIEPKINNADISINLPPRIAGNPSFLITISSLIIFAIVYKLCVYWINL